MRDCLVVQLVSLVVSCCYSNEKNLFKFSNYSPNCEDEVTTMELLEARGQLGPEMGHKRTANANDIIDGQGR